MESSSNYSFLKLNGANFRDWKQDVKMVLMDKGLSGFIDGTETLAADATEKEKLQFSSKALATVFLSQEDNQKDLIGEADDPSEAWKLLEDISKPKSRARIAALRN
ncbi:hypothetical protein JTE90_018641 [Oedothorax gibbosus]|uniref:Retrotransposon Copia-like N-terminal domain-containing protein n=1 Tax=Oedothorax gibbosus TaxID=931172 RepID=A0AAV6ULY5_9ARAC|nr:hypothetical protein JTE90_018641 [Oedothorax gibbosus]